MERGLRYGVYIFIIVQIGISVRIIRHHAGFKCVNVLCAGIYFILYYLFLVKIIGNVFICTENLQNHITLFDVKLSELFGIFIIP